MIIPDVILFNLIGKVLNFIELDFNSTNDETKTFLYDILNNVTISKYNFFEESKNLFLREKKSPRKLEYRMMFDAERAHLPTIHISMPGENSSNDGIGSDEGYEDKILDNENNTVKNIYTRSFDVNYNVIITSDNTLEVLLIYHVLKSCFIAMMDLIELEGLRNLKFGGQDLQINSELMPPNIFIRALSINCFYEQSVPSIHKDSLIKFITISQCIK